MICYAHSPKGSIPAQTYREHIDGVTKLAKQFADEAAAYNTLDGDALRKTAEIAASYHDLGKLIPENQEVLSGSKKASALPVNHVDAGTALCLSKKQSLLAACAIEAHHVGYPDFTDESIKGRLAFRDKKIAESVNEMLDGLAEEHTKSGSPNPEGINPRLRGRDTIFLRMLLSCLADADHTDTAIHYHQYPVHQKTYPLRAGERLRQLTAWADGFKSSTMSERNRLRSEMFDSCRDISLQESISACDSPVGSGKTTAVMAHLLAQAEKRGLRRIFVVLPYTNIIRQSVDVYRKRLTLPGEDPEEIVAELHHRAEFESEDLRYLTALWRAPIIVTTAVAFFETLASDTPSALRRLHELPGSAVFVDESHAALPAALLPITWQWINSLSQDWGCYWVLASGSLCKFWEIDRIRMPNQPQNVPQIVSEDLRMQLQKYEKNRVAYRHDLKSKNAAELAEWVQSFPGPRIVIMNTVQSAAVLASLLCKRYGRGSVEHLSTALIPNDRDKALLRIKERLASPDDCSWTLVATSCVEAGVDISFRTGFREIGALSSLLQAAGRVNREGKYSDSEMWSFCISEEDGLQENPGVQYAGNVLKQYLKKNTPIEPELTTQSISDEIALYGMDGLYADLLKQEKRKNFSSVEKEYKVIDSDTCLTVVDETVAKSILNGNINWKQLQQVSLQISRRKLEVNHIPAIAEDIYWWNRGYDDFLGYMAGVAASR